MSRVCIWPSRDLTSDALVSVLVWPLEATTGAISITRGDLNRLNEGEFLNDTLIEFGLRCDSSILAIPTRC